MISMSLTTPLMVHKIYKPFHIESRNSNLCIWMFGFMVLSELTGWFTYFLTNTVQNVLLGITLVDKGVSVSMFVAKEKQTWSQSPHKKDTFVSLSGKMGDVFHTSTSAWELNITNSIVLKFFNINSRFPHTSLSDAKCSLVLLSTLTF